MKTLSKKAEISPSATAAMHQIAAQKRSEGCVVYDFGAGDPLLFNHQAILEGAQKAMQKGYVSYPPMAGLLELRKIAAEWMNRRYGACYGIENVMVACGGKFSLLAALQILLEEEDEVLLSAPYWVSYPEMIRLCGGKMVTVRTSAKRGWKLDAEDLEKHLSPRTKILLLNNACNPTGALYSREELVDLVEWALKYEIFIISDEVYSELVYSGEFVSCGAIEKAKEFLIVVQSCSKNFGMTGWRVGFAFASPQMIAALSRLQSHCTTGTSIISQWAAFGAFERADEVSEYVRNEMKQRRDICVRLLKEMLNEKIEAPASGLYLFLPVDAFGRKESSEFFCKHALENSNAILVPGVAFGEEGYVRLSFAGNLNHLESGMLALKKCILDFN